MMNETGQQCNGPADNDPCDGCVGSEEIGNYIDLWYEDSSQVTMVQLVRALEKWRLGEGC